MMKIIKHKKKKTETEIPLDQPVMQENTDIETAEAEAETIQDFIELKRLQNRILGKLIDQISNSENSEKLNNK